MKHFELIDVPVDTRGHRHVITPRGARTNDRLTGTLVPKVLVGAVRLDEDADLSHLTDDDIAYLYTSTTQGVFDCATCGAYPSLSFVANTDGPHGLGLVSSTGCTLPDGALNITQLDVASGRIVLGASLRRLFDDIDEWPSINHVAGQIVHAHAFAARNAIYIHGRAGDSGGLFQLGDARPGGPQGGRFQIIAFSTDEMEPSITDPGMPILGPDAQFLAETGHDFDWIHIMDHGDFIDRCAELGVDPGDLNELQVIEFPNGLYQFVDHTTKLGYQDQHLPVRSYSPEDLDDDGEFDGEVYPAHLIADIFAVFPQSMRQYRAAHREIAEQDQDTTPTEVSVASAIFAEEQVCQAAIINDPTNTHLNGRLVGLQRARDIASEIEKMPARGQ